MPITSSTLGASPAHQTVTAETAGDDAAASYAAVPWDLSDLFPTPAGPEVETAIDQLRQAVAAFAGYQPRLEEQFGGTDWRTLLAEYDALERQLSRLRAYASLSFAADTQDETSQALQARMQQLGAEVENQTLFFQLWWKALPEPEAARLLDEAGPYRYWLESLRQARAYTLSEAEERVVNLKNVNGARALTNLYNAITNGYLFELDIDGQAQPLTREELMGYARHADPALREGAYRALLTTYQQDAPILGQLYQYRVRDWHSENVDLRGFASAMAPRNLANDLPPEVITTLLDVCRDQAGLFQRYFRLKARWLGQTTLRRFDLLAPVVENPRRYTFGEAVSLVLDGLRAFDSTFAGLAERVLAANHYDGQIRAGKRAGAFCASPDPALTPWILHSFTGQPRDVAVMAHELGHAVHSQLAANLPTLTFHASLPLAETASTFAEMAVIDHLLAGETDPGVRSALLFEQMDSAVGTIMRQAFFSLFEQSAHHLIQQGGRLQAIHDLYLDLLREQFGDAVRLDELFQYEWLTVPHFYLAPFYVYAYAFGQLLVVALYNQYRQEGPAFIPRFRALLAAGGSASPARLLARAGVDIFDARFWRDGFAVLEAMVAELERLPRPGPN